MSGPAKKADPFADFEEGIHTQDFDAPAAVAEGLADDQAGEDMTSPFRGPHDARPEQPESPSRSRSRSHSRRSHSPVKPVVPAAEEDAFVPSPEIGSTHTRRSVSPESPLLQIRPPSLSSSGNRPVAPSRPGKRKRGSDAGSGSDDSGKDRISRAAKAEETAKKKRKVVPSSQSSGSSSRSTSSRSSRSTSQRRKRKKKKEKRFRRLSASSLDGGPGREGEGEGEAVVVPVPVPVPVPVVPTPEEPEELESPSEGDIFSFGKTDGGRKKVRKKLSYSKVKPKPKKQRESQLPSYQNSSSSSDESSDDSSDGLKVLSAHSGEVEGRGAHSESEDGDEEDSDSEDSEDKKKGRSRKKKKKKSKPKPKPKPKPKRRRKKKKDSPLPVRRSTRFRKKKKKGTTSKSTRKKKARYDSSDDPEIQMRPKPSKSLSRQFRDIAKMTKRRVRKGDRNSHPVLEDREEKRRVAEKLRKLKGSESFAEDEANESDTVPTNERTLNYIFCVKKEPIRFVLSGRFESDASGMHRGAVTRELELNGGRIRRWTPRSNFGDLTRTIVVAGGGVPRTSFTFLIALVNDIPIVKVEWILECVRRKKLILPIAEEYLVQKLSPIMTMTKENVNVLSRHVDSIEDLLRVREFDDLRGKSIFICGSRDSAHTQAYKAALQMCGAKVLSRRNAPIDYLLTLSTVDAEMMAQASTGGYRVLTKQFLLEWWARRRRPPWSVVFERRVEWIERLRADPEGREYYKKVRVGEYEFSVNDVVELRHGREFVNDDSSEEESQSSFAEVRYCLIDKLFRSGLHKRNYVAFKSFVSASCLSLQDHDEMKENEFVLNMSLDDDEPLERILRPAIMCPYVCSVREGIFCVKEGTVMPNGTVKNLRKMDSKWPWSFNREVLEATWFQRRPERSQNERFYSFLVFDKKQYFISQWVHMKVVYEKKMEVFYGRLEEMLDDTRYGKVIIIRVANRIDSKTNEFRLSGSEKKIQVSCIRHMEPMEFTWINVAHLGEEGRIATLKPEQFNEPFGVTDAAPPPAAAALGALAAAVGAMQPPSAIAGSSAPPGRKPPHPSMFGL